MRVHSIDKNGAFMDIIESDNMFTKGGNFRSAFKHFWKRAVENNYDVVFSNDNKIRQIIIIRDNKE